MKKRSLFEKIALGKNNSTDFTAADLPKNRFELIKRLFRNRFGLLSKISFLTTLCFLPIIIWWFMCLLYQSNVYEKMLPEEYLVFLGSFTIIQYGSTIPFLVLAFYLLSGFFYLLRKLAWNEIILFKEDYRKGLKDSGKQFAIIGFIVGLILMLITYSKQFIGSAQIEPRLSFIIIISLYLISILLIIILMFALSMASLYNVSLGRLIINSFILTFKFLFKNIGIFLIAFIPVCFWFLIPYLYLKIIGIFLLAIINFSYLLLIMTTYTHAVFDKVINLTNYPANYRAGLKKE